MERSVTVYLPNGDMVDFETNKNEVESICLVVNNSAVQVTFKNGEEKIYVNTPFIYRDRIAKVGGKENERA